MALATDLPLTHNRRKALEWASPKDYGGSFATGAYQGAHIEEPTDRSPTRDRRTPCTSLKFT